MRKIINFLKELLEDPENKPLTREEIAYRINL